LQSFFDGIDDIQQLNLLYNNSVDVIVDTIRSDVARILVVEVIWDGWYDKTILETLPRTIQQ